MEITKLLTQLKDNFKFEINIQRIYAKQNRLGIFCYYVSIADKFCPFKNREHDRDISPIYFEISINGIFVKCHDEECRRRVFPEYPIALPENIETEYPEMYLSMSTKYWKSDLCRKPASDSSSH